MSRVLTVVVLLLAGCGPAEVEVDAEHCFNEVDDDGDGLLDCADPYCADRVHCRGAFVHMEEARERLRLQHPPGASSSGDYECNQLGGDIDGDGLADLGVAWRLGESWTDSEDPISEAEVSVFLSSQEEPPGLIPTGDRSFSDAHLQLEQPPVFLSDSLADSNCDVSGDGVADLVAVDQWSSYWEVPELLHLRVWAGGELWTLPIPVWNDAYWLRCAGDMDGDGHDDLLLQAGGRLRLISGGLLGPGGTLAEVTTRIWSESTRRTGRIRLGDVDGDGYDDISINAHDPPPYEVEAERWFAGWVVPGGPHLGQWSEVDLITQEERPAIWIDVEPWEPEDPYFNSLGVSFFDLFGSELPELLLFVPGEERYEVFPGELLGDLSEDVFFSRSDAVAVLDRRDPVDEEADPTSMSALQAADLDGDGHQDLLLRLGSQDVANYDDRPAVNGGAGIIFGDGTAASFDRLADQVDVVLLDATYPFATPDREGGEGVDLRWCGLGDSNLVPGEDIGPVVGVVESELLTQWKLPQPPGSDE